MKDSWAHNINDVDENYKDERLANEWIQGAKERQGIYRNFISIIQKQKLIHENDRLLDIGCGPGFLPVMISETYPSIKIIATDSSPAMIDYASRMKNEKNLANLDFRIDDILASELPSDHFNIVISFMSLYLWKDKAAGMAQVLRILKGDGTALFVHPNRDLKYDPNATSIPQREMFESAIYNGLTENEIESLFKECGIRDFSISYSGAFDKNTSREEKLRKKAFFFYTFFSKKGTIV